MAAVSGHTCEVLVATPAAVEELLFRGRDAVERARLLQRRAQQAVRDSAVAHGRAWAAVRRSFVAMNVPLATRTTCGLCGLEIHAYDKVMARNDDLIHEMCNLVLGLAECG